MKPKKHYLFPSDYMADRAAHVFNGKLYIYPSHDWEAGAEEDDDGGHFQMKDYHALLLEDPENGEATDLGVIFDVKDVSLKRMASITMYSQERATTVYSVLV